MNFDYSLDDQELASLLQRAMAAGIQVVEFHRVETDLEDIFMHTTMGNLQ